MQIYAFYCRKSRRCEIPKVSERVAWKAQGQTVEVASIRFFFRMDITDDVVPCRWVALFLALPIGIGMAPNNEEQKTRNRLTSDRSIA
jgi:hypothetical protein